MITNLVRYVMLEGNYSEDKATEIAHSIVHSVDDLIHMHSKNEEVDVDAKDN